MTVGLGHGASRITDERTTRGPTIGRVSTPPTHGFAVLLVIVAMVAGCGQRSGSAALPTSPTAVSTQRPASDVTIAATTSTLASSVVVPRESVPIDVPDTIPPLDPNATSTLPPPSASVHGAMAAWDMCVQSGPMQVIDANSGKVLTTVGLAGRPAWSPDGRQLATLDNDEGTVRIADIATGHVRTVAELHVPPFNFDNCDTSGRVDWSPDGTTLLVNFSDFTSADIRSVVSVVRVDTAAQATLFDEQHSPLDSAVGASWMDDGEVMIADAMTDGRLMVEHAEPWGSWPPPVQTLAIPTQVSLGRPVIAPDGGHIAIATYGPPSLPPANPDPSADRSVPDGAIMMVDLADGRTDTIDRYAAFAISFARDSGRIAFIGEGGLVVVPVGSTTPSTLPSFTAPFGGSELSWSPDGGSIASNSPFGVQRVDLTTGVVRDLSSPPGTGGADWVMEWQPE